MSKIVIPAEKIELYEKLVATNPQVKWQGPNKTYTSLNGNMFSFLTREGSLALRLPAVEREAFIAKYNTQLCVQYGTVMKEYVDVPDSLFENAREIQNYFDVSFHYVSSLKPKPTKRK